MSRPVGIDAVTGSAGQAGPTGDLVAGRHILPTSARPLVMGVLNVTPDSFSDGGLAYDPARHPEAAIEAGLRLADEGADLIDVGGESTRPGSEPVPVDVELARVVEVVAALDEAGIVVSIDTTKPEVARAAIAAGASMVNDVSGTRRVPALLDVVAESDVAYVLMHAQGTPATMQVAPTYRDVVGDVEQWLADGLARLVDHGVVAERVVLDPGIGFGKTVAHNLALLAGLDRLVALGRPVMVGASRKSFLGAVTGVDEPRARLAGSLASAALAVAAGARIVRVHDVADTVAAVAVATAIGAIHDETDTSASAGRGERR